MLNKDNIDQLLLKHLLQENAVEEEQLLKEWLGHDPEHQRYFERFRRHHIHLQAAIQSGRIQGQYIEFASRLKRRHIRRLFIRVAAIALILLGGGLSFYLIHTPSLIPTLAEVPIHPGSSKAILHLSSGTAIPVNTTSQELKEKDGTLIRISNEGVLNYAESANISTANLIPTRNPQRWRIQNQTGRRDRSMVECRDRTPIPNSFLKPGKKSKTSGRRLF